MQILRVQKLKLPELEQIADLHYTVLNESFLNNFGLNFLKIVYPTITKSSHNITLLAKDKNRVHGFLVATKDGDKFNREITNKDFFALFGQILKSSILKPQILIKIIQWKFKHPHPSKIKPELQFLAIDPKFQGQGLGTKMIKVLGKEFKKSAINQYRVGTKAQNKLSNKFYKKLEFKLFYKDQFFGDDFNYYLSPKF